MKTVTPTQHDFGTHFEETVAAAAAGDLAAKPLAFFVPTSPAVDARFEGMRKRLELRSAAARREQVDRWLRKKLTPVLGVDTCVLPAEEFAAAIRARGIYGKEIEFAGDEPGVMRFALMGRVQGGSDDIIASMTYEPTFELPKAKAGE